MKSFARLIPVSVLALLAVACQGHPPAVDHRLPEGTITHVVICWLNERGDDTAKQELIDAAAKLRQIPDVGSVNVGTMLSSDRPVVDTTYDVAYVMTFRSEDAMRRYVTNPIHVAVKRDVLDRYAHMKVYDFVAK